MPKASLLFLRNALLSAAVLATTGTPASAAPPRVTTSTPLPDATGVDPALNSIRVTFDQDMSTRSFSWVGGGPTFPTTRDKPRWINARTCILPVRLKPNHEYWLSINSNRFQNFRSKSGEPAIPYPISFKTGPAKAGTRTTSKPAAEEEDPQPDHETSALEFKLQDTFGREIRSSDYARTPVAIILGACWCGGCQQDAEPFADLAARFGPRGVQFIRSVSGDNELESLEFQRHYRLPFVNVLDPDRTFEKRYNPDGWTFIMLVDQSGKVVYRANNPKMTSLAASLEKLVPPQPEAQPIVRDGVSYMRATLERSGEIDKARPSERFPALACGPDKTTYLAFSGNRRGNNDVFVRVHDGRGWSQDRPVAATEADEFDASVLVDRQKQAWVSWTSNSEGNKYNVFVTSLDASGKPAPAVQLSHADDDAMHARMACDRKGRIWCTYYRWHRMGRFSRDKEVYVRRYDGKEWSPEMQVSPTDVPNYEDHSDPTIAAYRDGILLGWSWDYHTPPGYTRDAECPTIFLREVGQDLRLGQARHVSGRSIDVTPTLVVDGKDRIWCAWDALGWDDDAGANRKTVQVAQRDMSAFRPQPAQALSPPSTNVCTPVLAVAPDETVSLVWSQNQRRTGWTLQLANCSPLQSKWSDPTEIESAGNPRFPSATYDAAGTLWVAYSAEGTSGPEIKVKTITRK
ncbi:MAG TPA: redoxin domain-containing protein [Phycisphaerae bacterium]|nr:redoxin domain-containing protein [Phycisphaerae bacterium]HRY69078.1 redoxin domain-containing protein [Phycisphaerae bacterium]HSA25947.1 redoxin domain-containing protein [Phycisphaerae bacterium]